MRILIISNFFPPARPGGYTQWCQEIVEGLIARGHTIGVLTSRHELEKAPLDESIVYRLLHLEGDLARYDPAAFFTTRKRHQRENAGFVRQVIDEFDPDLVFVWGMWALSKKVPEVAESLMSSKLVYFLSDYWPAAENWHVAYWKLPAQRWFMRLPKCFLGFIATTILAIEREAHLEFENVICVSKAVRDLLIESNIPVENAEIIYGGTDIDRFRSVTSHNRHTELLRLLYAGQVVPHKGVHTAVEAMEHLIREENIEKISLTLVGSGPKEYMTSLEDWVKEHNLQDYIEFLGSVLKDDMASVLAQHDILVFPSIYEEPLARITQEAMVSGLAVVGTTTGGTKEILVDGENGLTFPPGDAIRLARQVKELANNAELRFKLAEAGRNTVLERFNLNRMIDEIEQYLLRVLS